MHLTDDKRYRSDVLQHAQKLLGYFTYKTDDARQDWGSIAHPDKNGHADCSSFVWLVMKQSGYDVGSEAFSTPEMEEDARGQHRFFRRVRARDIRPGDVVIVNKGQGYGPSGHTAVIDSPYRGRKTQIIQIGGDKPGGDVHRSQIGPSFGSLLDGGRITYARPVK